MSRKEDKKEERLEERLMAALLTAEKIRDQIRADPEILNRLAGKVQQLDDEIEGVSKKLTDLQAERATINSQIALIKGAPPKKAGAKGQAATGGRGKAKLAAEYINSRGVGAVISPNDLKVDNIGMVGGYPGTWLTNMTEQGYFTKTGQGEYKLEKLLPV